MTSIQAILRQLPIRYLSCRLNNLPAIAGAKFSMLYRAINRLGATKELWHSRLYSVKNNEVPLNNRVHWIYGSGLIGSYLGAVLGQTYHVQFIGRATWNQRLSAGIKLEDYSGASAAFKVSATQAHTAPPIRLDNAVIWLTVKCTAIDATLSDLQGRVGQSCTIICCQNGIGTVEKVKAALPGCTVLHAVVGFNVVWDEANQLLLRATEGVLAIEDGQSDDTAAGWLTSPDTSLLPVHWPKDMQAYCWAKLQLNLANAVNALADIPIKQMLLDKHFRQIIAALMDELLAVASAKGFELPQLTKVPAAWVPRLLRLPNWLFTRIASKMLDIDEHARSSMWWDIQAGKPTEINYLNGAVVEGAKQHDLSCTANKNITRLVEKVSVDGTNGKLAMEMSPQTLKSVILG